jgi:hypothetical protein
MLLKNSNDTIGIITKITEIKYEAEKRSKHPETFNKLYFWD